MTRLEIAARLLAAAPLPAGALAYDRKVAITDALAYADALLAAAEKPAEAAPVDRCVARGCMASATHTDVRGHLSAPCCGGEKCCGVPYGWTRVPLAGEVAAAPTVAAVKFDAKGDALTSAGYRARPDAHGWEADRAGGGIGITIMLRPGEDAGETLAKALAACGREP